MFSKPILYLFYNFNLWGFCTELTELRMSQLWAHFIFVFQLIFSGFLCAVSCIFTYQNLHERLGFLVVANNTLKLGAVVISYWFIIVESYHRRPVQRKFWQIYRQTDGAFTHCDGKSGHRRYLVKFSIFFVIATIIYIKQFVGLNIEFNGTFFYFAFSYVGLIVMQDMRIFHYLFFVLLLENQLNTVEKQMELLANVSHCAKIPSERLKWIRIQYDLVHDLLNCMNEVFGWSNIAIILCLFLRLVVDMNWTYYRIQNAADVMMERMCFHNSIINIL